MLLQLVSCSKPAIYSKDEIEQLCKSVGDKAFAMANDGHQPYENLHWIEQGAVAECKLKYLTK